MAPDEGRRLIATNCNAPSGGMDLDGIGLHGRARRAWRPAKAPRDRQEIDKRSTRDRRRLAALGASRGGERWRWVGLRVCRNVLALFRRLCYRKQNSVPDTQLAPSLRPRRACRARPLADPRLAPPPGQGTGQGPSPTWKTKFGERNRL